MATNTLAENISSAIELINILRNICDGSECELVIPNGTTQIRNYAFQGNQFIVSVSIPSSITTIGVGAFNNCASLSNVTLLNGLLIIGEQAFSENDNITEITIPSTVTSIDRLAFRLCHGLTTLNIQTANVWFHSYGVFAGNSNLEFVTLASGFNGTNLDLSSSTKYSASTIVSWLNALKDNTGKTPKTLIIGSTNIAKLTNEQIAIATNKNWNLA